ncbi:MAG: phosphatase PAP2 family protein [Pirellulales bacterium]
MSAAGKPEKLLTRNADTAASAAGLQASNLRWSSLDRLCMALFGLGAAALLASLFLLGHDLTLSQSLRNAHVPGDIRKAVELSEAFAHGSGATMILVAIFVASSRRSVVWIAVAMTATSGVIANILKAFFTRPRPYTYDVATDITRAVSGDVTGWQFLGSGSFWDAAHRSFPSGHTATAWGLAIGLSMIYPRGTVVFICLAMLATYQRLYSGAHFLSDVCAGFTVACWCCAAILCIPYFRRLRDQCRRSAA